MRRASECAGLRKEGRSTGGSSGARYRAPDKMVIRREPSHAHNHVADRCLLEFAGSITGRWARDCDTLLEIPGVAAVEDGEENFPQA